MRKALLSLLAAILVSCSTIPGQKSAPSLEEIPMRDFSPPQKMMMSFYDGNGIVLAEYSNGDEKPDEEFHYKITRIRLLENLTDTNPNFSNLSYIFVAKERDSLFGNVLFTGTYEEGFVFLGDYNGDGKFDDKLYYELVGSTNPDSSLANYPDFYFLKHDMSEEYVRN